MLRLNETHDATLTSWVAGAEPGRGDFPIQNLPFGVFLTPDTLSPRAGVAIGTCIVDIERLAESGLLQGDAADAASLCRDGLLNRLMAAGHAPASALRLALSRLLRTGAAQRSRVEACLVRMSSVQMQLPARICGYTDFFTSINHANNCSRIFDPNKPELPNFRSLPIAYNGRASTVVPSGTPCVRPRGQMKPRDAQFPIFSPTRLLDCELEVGCYVGTPSEHCVPVALEDAEQHMFGLSLVNDWSARDIQAWEMMPLGPFLGKSFMTSISPWVVTLEALAPFRTAAADRGGGPVPLLPYLDSESNRSHGGIDIELHASIRTLRMRENNLAPHCFAKPKFRDQFWTLFQMLTHHTSNGCNLLPGDLLASGTVSGARADELGCLLELTEAGAKPVQLPNGEVRTFLEDGDEVIMSGTCHRRGYVSIGFGECSGQVV